MLLLSPSAAFGALVLQDLVAATVSRVPVRIVAEHTDVGPHVGFADVAEFQTTIRLVGRVLKDDVNVPTPGQSATLTMITTASGSDRPRRKISATCTLLSVKYDFMESKGCARTLEFLATSDGSDDPLSITDG